jgi:hypothetical protein
MHRNNIVAHKTLIVRFPFPAIYLQALQALHFHLGELHQKTEAPCGFSFFNSAEACISASLDCKEVAAI